MTAESKTTRWGVTAGAIGLAAGLALGLTGLAGASSPSPEPSHDTVRAHHGKPGGGPGLMRHRRPGGLVTAVSDTSLTFRTPFGSRTVGLSSSTAYYEGATKASRSAVSVGDLVGVRLADPRATNPVASVVVVLPAHLAGWVTAVNGSTLTIKDLQGFTRTLTTSSSTKVMKDGAEAKASDITVGSFLHATGSVAADGTTLQASKVAMGQPAKRADKPERQGPPPGAPGSELPEADEPDA